jgi:ferritin
MEERQVSLINESIKLELHASELYSLFCNTFPEDADFWWTLALEERNHAALFRTANDYFELVNKFPHDLLADNLQKVQETNRKLEELIKKFSSVLPLRQEAFHLALDLENSATELHFQNYINKKESSTLDNIFKRLNKDDKDHAQRISSYMEKQGINSVRPGK